MNRSSSIVSAEQDDPVAADTFFATLYSELHSLARRQLARNGGGISLEATTLLHETYLDISQRDGIAFPDRARFMAYAARVMRGKIIDYARNCHSQKRGGGFHITALVDDVVDPAADAQELTWIANALEELAAVEAALAEVVDLKFFRGFSFAEIATMRGVSERTVQRHWEKARLHLHRILRHGSWDAPREPSMDAGSC